jgi:hypothetical protein
MKSVRACVHLKSIGMLSACIFRMSYKLLTVNILVGVPYS